MTENKLNQVTIFRQYKSIIYIFIRRVSRNQIIHKEKIFHLQEYQKLCKLLEEPICLIFSKYKCYICAKKISLYVLWRDLSNSHWRLVNCFIHSIVIHELLIANKKVVRGQGCMLLLLLFSFVLRYSTGATALCSRKTRSWCVRSCTTGNDVQ